MPISLLELSPRIRLQIYAYAGALGAEPNELPLFSSKNAQHHSHYRSAVIVDLNHHAKPRTAAGSTTLNLLLTCSIIYHELSKYIYSGHRFVVRFQDARNLDALSRLRPSSIRALRRLTVHLHSISCGFGYECADEVDPFAKPASCDRQALTIQNETHKALLNVWLCVWTKHIRPHLTPELLELDLVCDVADHWTAECALSHFLAETQPYMAKCNIRLARRKDVVLNNLAKRAIESIVCPRHLVYTYSKGHARSRSCTFVDLPAEIRQRILEYTDLVVPAGEVEWSPTFGWYLRRGNGKTWYYQGEGDEIMHLEPTGEDMSAVIDDARAPPEAPYWEHPREYCREKLAGRGCFCKARHSAYSSYSKLPCWAPPTSLFLVNKLVRHDALRVFFGNNRIVVFPPDGRGLKIDPVTTSPSRLHISAFLMDVVPKDALCYLRRLELVLPPFRDCLHVAWCPAGSREHSDWVQTINVIKPHITPSKLMLSVHFPLDETYYYGGRSSEVELAEGPYVYSEEEFASRRQCYFNTVLPLAELGPMKRFRVHIETNMWDPEDDFSYVEKWEIEMEQAISGPGFERPEYELTNDYRSNRRALHWERDLDWTGH